MISMMARSLDEMALVCILGFLAVTILLIFIIDHKLQFAGFFEESAGGMCLLLPAQCLASSLMEKRERLDYSL
ncbi:hypothetical protein DN062_18055 [Nitrincola tibetensis]|uniref:Uncharacterized protein n=1 Tax=Nitrincola tibetensis TaxID=2219697 RepID=A0A364NHV8_9GAMM|nr:hypothetical protein DN062_18055 [Nitrincola tibetensis]